MFAGALCRAAPLQAEPSHPALRSLVPLVEVFAAGQPIPGYDVAGLRCAGLRLAQDDWTRRNPGVAGPTATEMAEVDLMLQASENHRLSEGGELGRVHVSLERDARRVWRLYLRRFDANLRKAGHPWQGDPLVTGDTGFCKALARRS